MRHHNPLLITNRSWILTILKDKIFWKNLLEKTFLSFKKWVKNIQTLGYNGARTVYEIFKVLRVQKKNSSRRNYSRKYGKVAMGLHKLYVSSTKYPALSELASAWVKECSFTNLPHCGPGTSQLKQNTQRLCWKNDVPHFSVLVHRITTFISNELLSDSNLGKSKHFFLYPDHKLTSKSRNGTELFNRNKIRVGRKGYRIIRSFTSIKSKHIFNRLIIIIVRHFLPSKIAWAKNRLILDNLHQPRPSVDVIFFLCFSW